MLLLRLSTEYHHLLRPSRVWDGDMEMGCDSPASGSL